MGFIQLYRSLPCLRKIKSKDYSKKNLKSIAYEKLIDLCKNFEYAETNRDFVIKKIQSLRGSFRKELKKVKYSKKTATAEDDVYKPSLWYFDYLLFTQDQEEPSSSINNIINDETIKVDDDFDDNNDDGVDDDGWALISLQNRSEVPEFIETATSGFKRNFRMSRGTANLLAQRFEESNFAPQRNHGGSQPISCMIHIYSFLWFCGNKCCIRDVASRFGMGESTFISTSERVMKFLWEIAPSIICFPSSDEGMQNIANEFEKLTKFPNVVGCIDGTYIPLRTPAYKIKSTYTNRHDYPSLTLQGICDANKRFLDVFTGVSSKMHDARIFRLSFMSKKIENICSHGRWHLLGDAAYPLREYLLTPFRDYGNLSPEQVNFNLKLCGTRVKIENTFGLLKQRFRQLIRTDFYSVKKTSEFIMAVCVLHNLCIDSGDYWDEDNSLHDDDNNLHHGNMENSNRSEITMRLMGEKKTIISEYLSNLH